MMLGAGLTIALACAWTAYALAFRPILVHTLGQWDCACGGIYIKTTIRSIWNPFRDRQPEIVADHFLSQLRANNCAPDDKVCRQSMPSKRVSVWTLSYREDAGNTASLFYKLGKYGQITPSPGSVGVVDVEKTRAGWRVLDFSAYF